jgi:eukaryotic-like serine/threonine-protein kinase
LKFFFWKVLSMAPHRPVLEPITQRLRDSQLTMRIALPPRQQDIESLATFVQKVHWLQEVGQADRDVLQEISKKKQALPNEGESFLDFELIQKLGEGGFGRVFLAQQTSLAKRLVAIKISTGMYDETQTLAQLQHTNIVPIYSMHERGELQGVVMPYFGATTLADIYHSVRSRDTMPESGDYFVQTLASRQKSVEANPTMAALTTQRVKPQDTSLSPTGYDLNLRETVTDVAALIAAVPEEKASEPKPSQVQIFKRLSYVDSILWLTERIALALAHAHEKGIIHRDLKPANILLADDGQPMVLDFNLAADTKKNAALTRGGTLPYMSPEQLEQFHGKDRSIDGRSDIYSLGLILFQLLSGRELFPNYGGSMKQALPRMLADRTQPEVNLRTNNPSVTPAMLAIVAKCLAPDREDRYADAAELAAELKRQRTNQRLQNTVEPSRKESFRKWRKRHPKLVSPTAIGAVAAGLIMLATTGVVYLRYHAYSASLVAMRELGQTQIYNFDRQSELAKQYLASHNEEPEWIRTGLKHGLGALKTLGALNNPDWLQADAYSHLLDNEKKELQAKVDETTFFVSLAQTNYPHYTDGLDVNFPMLDVTKLPPSKQAFVKAAQLQAEGKYAESLKVLEPETTRNPQAADAWFLTGRAYEMLSKYGEAWQAFNTCIALKPDFAPAYSRRSEASNSNGNRTNLTDLREAVRLLPDSVHLQMQLAKREMNWGEKQKAWKTINAVCAKPDAPVLAFWIRSAIATRLGKAEEAAADAKQAMQMEHSTLEDYCARGFARMTKEPKLALQDFQTAEEINPRHIIPLQNQAEVYAELLKDPKAAIACLDRLLKVHTDYLPGLCARAIYLARAGDKEAALAAIPRILQVSDMPFSQYRVACVHALLAKEDPKHASLALKHLAIALEKGYGFDYVPIDDDLNGLKGDPAFELIQKFTRQLTELKQTKKTD